MKKLMKEEEQNNLSNKLWASATHTIEVQKNELWIHFKKCLPIND